MQLHAIKQLSSVIRFRIYSQYIPTLICIGKNSKILKKYYFILGFDVGVIVLHQNDKTTCSVKRRIRNCRVWIVKKDD